MADLEFKLWLKEMASGVLKKFEGTTHSVFENVDKDIAATQKNLNGLGNEVKLKVDSSALDGVHEKMGLLKESAAMFLGSLAERGVERGLEFLKEQVGDVLEGGMEASKTKAQIKVMAGDEAGEKLYEDTHAYIPTSMFGPELFQDEKVLLGMGETAKNMLTDIKQMGDISMGDAQHMESIGLALGETISGGKFTALQQRILRPTGFNPLQELHRATGESVASLTKKMEDGEFTINMYRKAMEAATTEGGRFYQMQEKIKETPFGKMQIMQTNIAMDKEELGVALLPAEARMMDAFKPLIDALPGELERIQPALEHLVDDFTDLVKWVSNNTDVIGNWFNVIKAGTEIYIGYKAVTLAAGIAMNTYSKATEIATITNRLFGASEAATTAATAAQGITVTVAASDYAYYTTATVEATEATEALDAALTVTPWGVIAAGIGLVAGAYLLLKDNSNDLHNPNIGDMSTPLTIEEQQKLDKNYAAWTKKVKRDSTVSVSGLGIVPDMTYNPKDDAAAAERVAKKDTPPMSGSTDSSDAITGGGRKQIIINVKSFADHFVVNAGNLRDAASQSKEVFMRMFLEVLESANTAM